MDTTLEKEYRRLTTPRAAAVAGILFALLFAASLILLRSSIPERLSTNAAWVATGYRRITIALGLMPFAGIAYLWFIGVVRDKLGDYEDRFFSTVFYGSSLLFLGMVFVAMAIMGGLVAGYRLNPGMTLDSQMIYFSRAMMIQLSNVYALRMAGVTMISLGTIWLRTGLAPRWLVWVSYALALALLLVVNFSLWVTLIYPAWVLLISLFILWLRYKHPEARMLASE
ncbi:MAG TPA: hypothetical protein DEH22_10050 [Chloroflexi bacterium]|nr:hypothetical protein [Chloroflexota bacterium]